MRPQVSSQAAIVDNKNFFGKHKGRIGNSEHIEVGKEIGKGKAIDDQEIGNNANISEIGTSYKPQEKRVSQQSKVGNYKWIKKRNIEDKNEKNHSRLETFKNDINKDLILHRGTTEDWDMNLIETETESLWVERCAIAEVKQIEILENLQGLLETDNILEIVIKHLGGMQVLIECHSKDAMLNIITKQQDWFLQWCKWVAPWNNDLKTSERLIWIQCRDIPLNAWNIQTFNLIGAKFGKVIQIHDDTLDKNNIGICRILILTEMASFIDVSLKAMIGKKIVQIHVREDVLAFTSYLSDEEDDESDDSEGNEEDKESVYSKEEDNGDNSDNDLEQIKVLCKMSKDEDTSCSQTNYDAIQKNKDRIISELEEKRDITNIRTYAEVLKTAIECADKPITKSKDEIMEAPQLNTSLPIIELGTHMPTMEIDLAPTPIAKYKPRRSRSCDDMRILNGKCNFNNGLRSASKINGGLGTNMSILKRLWHEARMKETEDLLSRSSDERENRYEDSTPLPQSSDESQRCRDIGRKIGLIPKGSGTGSRLAS